MDKYWFPLLAQHLKENGMTKTEFMSKAAKIKNEPKSRAWSNAMSEKNGISETYAYKCKYIMEKLDFPDEIYLFTKL